MIELSLKISVFVLIISILVSFFAGLFTKNYSHTDRLWSILPPIYAIIWMFKYYNNPRFIIVAILIIAWGIRLSYNFYRRGGYAFSWQKGFTGEDYRWKILEKRINNRFLYEIFNLLFISGFQLSLIFAFTLPLYFIGVFNQAITPIEIVLFLVHILFLILETVADNQQFQFHTNKHLEENKNKHRYQLGFNTFGLWKYSRHPNYVFEMGQWILVWIYACIASSSLHLSGIGALILIILFVGSTIMTEGITADKYPKYREWQQLCSFWIPFYKTFFKSSKRKQFLGLTP